MISAPAYSTHKYQGRRGSSGGKLTDVPKVKSPNTLFVPCSDTAQMTAGSLNLPLKAPLIRKARETAAVLRNGSCFAYSQTMVFHCS